MHSTWHNASLNAIIYKQLEQSLQSNMPRKAIRPIPPQIGLHAIITKIYMLHHWWLTSIYIQKKIPAFCIKEVMYYIYSLLYSIFFEPTICRLSSHWWYALLAHHPAGLPLYRDNVISSLHHTITVTTIMCSLDAYHKKPGRESAQPTHSLHWHRLIYIYSICKIGLRAGIYIHMWCVYYVCDTLTFIVGPTLSWLCVSKICIKNKTKC